MRKEIRKLNLESSNSEITKAESELMKGKNNTITKKLL